MGKFRNSKSIISEKKIQKESNNHVHFQQRKVKARSLISGKNDKVSEPQILKCRKI